MISSFAHSGLSSKKVLSSTSASITLCMSYARRSSSGTVSRIGPRRRVRTDCVDIRRPHAPVRRQIRQESTRGRDRLRVVGAQIVAAAADGRVHPRAAHLVEPDLLPDHDLGHARRAEVHRSVAFDHEHDIAERGDVGTTRGRRPEQAAHLRDLARQPNLIREDAARAAAPGEELDLIGDARARRVDEVDDGELVLQRVLGEADDLLDRACAPRSRLHRRVVGHHAHGPPVDPADAGDHTIRGEVARERVGEQAVLDERS